MNKKQLTPQLKHPLENPQYSVYTYILIISIVSQHPIGQFSLPNDKRQLYDFDIRVPLMIRGPGIPAGSQNTDPVMNIDIMPTIVALSGEQAPSDVDGMSLIPLLVS